MARLASQAAPSAHPTATQPATLARQQRRRIAQPDRALVAPSSSDAPPPPPAEATSAAPTRAIAWELRLIGWIPLPAFAAGAVVAAGIGGLLVAARMVAGRPLCAPSGLAPAEDLATGFITAALVGYTMAAGRYLNAAILGDLLDAAGHGRHVIAELTEIEIFGTDRAVLRRSRLAGFIGVLFGLGILQLAGVSDRLGVGTLGDPELVCWLVLVPLLFFLLSRAAFNTALGSRERADAGPRPKTPEIDLLDLRPIFALGRVGLRMALVWVVGSTISSLYVFDPEVAGSVLSLMPIGVIVAVFALTLPARRLHRAIRSAKQREMDRLRDELHRVRDDVVERNVDQSGRLADLLGYWSYLENLREWPFDNPTVTRFLLYLMIPLGSWLGGALVERLVSAVLD